MNKKYILQSVNTNLFLTKDGELTDDKLKAIQFTKINPRGVFFKKMQEKNYNDKFFWVEHNRIELHANFEINLNNIFGRK